MSGLRPRCGLRAGFLPDRRYPLPQALDCCISIYPWIHGFCEPGYGRTSFLESGAHLPYASYTPIARPAAPSSGHPEATFPVPNDRPCASFQKCVNFLRLSGLLQEEEVELFCRAPDHPRLSWLGKALLQYIQGHGRPSVGTPVFLGASFRNRAHNVDSLPLRTPARQDSSVQISTVNIMFLIDNLALG